MLGLIWVQTVFKSYQQMTLVGKELTVVWFGRNVNFAFDIVIFQNPNYGGKISYFSQLKF